MRFMRSHSVFAAATVAWAAGSVACSSSPTGPPPPTFTHPAGTVDSIFPLGSRPYGVSVSGSGGVLVSRLDNLTAMHATIGDFRLTAGANVGNVPTDVAFAPGGAHAFVANQADFTVGKIDVASLTQTATLPVGTNAFRVKVNAAGTKLYATTNGDSMFVIDPSSFTVLKKVGVGASSNGLAFDSSGAKLYVSSQNGLVKVVQTSNDSVIATIAAGPHPQDVAISPDGTEMWVADETLGVQVYSLPAGSLLTTLPSTTGAFGLAISPDGQQVWVSMPSTGQFQIFTRASRAFVKGFTAGTPRRVAFDSTGAHAVVTDEQAGAVLFN